MYSLQILDIVKLFQNEWKITIINRSLFTNSDQSSGHSLQGYQSTFWSATRENATGNGENIILPLKTVHTVHCCCCCSINGWNLIGTCSFGGFVVHGVTQSALAYKISASFFHLKEEKNVGIFMQVSTYVDYSNDDTVNSNLCMPAERGKEEVNETHLYKIKEIIKLWLELMSRRSRCVAARVSTLVLARMS